MQSRGEPTRRNRTRQRERLLELLRGTDTHPTAHGVHALLVDEFPRLSLGTVYRNLEVLVSEGQVREVPTAGPTRYDANLAPHHHFVCEGCGHIDDVELRLAEPERLAGRVRRRYGLRARHFRIDFYGLCHACSERDEANAHQP